MGVFLLDGSSWPTCLVEDKHEYDFVVIPVLIPKQNDLKKPEQNESGENEDSDDEYNENEITWFCEVNQRNVVH